MQSNICTNCMGYKLCNRLVKDNVPTGLVCPYYNPVSNTQVSTSSLPENIKQHIETCKKLSNTYRIKNEAYGDSFSKTYKELGIISAVTRIVDKCTRLVALTTGAKNDVHDESLDDTLLDMANYCIMTYMERQAEKNGCRTGS